MMLEIINFKSILRCKLYSSGIFNKLKNVIYALIYNIDLRILNNNANANANVIVFDSTLILRRDDYRKLICNFNSELENEGVKSTYIKVIPVVYLKGLFLKIMWVINNYDSQLSLYEQILSSYYYQAVKVIDNKAGSILSNATKTITFCDAHPMDNAFTQISLKYNCITYTLQHGFYVHSDNSINSEVYSNFISDYMLVWGEATVEILVGLGVSVQRLIISGSFKTPLKTYQKRNIKNIKFFLNGSHTADANILLIELSNTLSLLDYNCIIRRHPDDHCKYKVMPNVLIEKRDVSIEDSLMNSDLIIAHSTGLIFDLLSSNYNVMLLDDGNLPSEYSFDEISFTSDELVLRVKIQNIPKIKTNKFMSKKIKLRSIFDNN